MREGRAAPTVAGASLMVPGETRDPKLQPPKSPVAYFININVTNKRLHDKLPKMRIKIPTLLVETLKKTRRSSQGCINGVVVVNDNNTNNTQKRWVDPRKLFLDRVNPKILKAFGRKSNNSDTISSSNSDQHSSDDTSSNYYSNEISSNYNSDESNRGSFHAETNPNIFDHDGSNDLESFSSVSLSSNDSRSSEIYPLFSAFSLATKSPLCDLRGTDSEQSIQKICIACKQPLPLGEEEEEWLRFGEEGEEVKKTCRVSSLCFREERKYGMAPLFSCLLGSVNKRPPLNSMKGERSNFCKGSSSANSNSESDGCFSRESGSCSSNSSTVTPTRFPIKINKSQTWLTETEDEDEDNNDHELCKKRILIGERCRLQNFSDSLHYDKNGNPLPVPRPSPPHLPLEVE